MAVGIRVARGTRPRAERHPPFQNPGLCVPETAAWLPSTPCRSPTPPADPRRAAGLQKAGPSAACRSDICSPRGELLRSYPLAAPETAEGEASAAAESRAEPSAAQSRKERRGSVGGAAGALASGSWRRGRAGRGEGEVTTCF